MPRNSAAETPDETYRSTTRNAGAGFQGGWLSQRLFAPCHGQPLFQIARLCRNRCTSADDSALVETRSDSGHKAWSSSFYRCQSWRGVSVIIRSSTPSDAKCSVLCRKICILVSALHFERLESVVSKNSYFSSCSTLWKSRICILVPYFEEMEFLSAEKFVFYSFYPPLWKTSICSFEEFVF